MNYGEELFNIMASTRFANGKGTLDPAKWKEVAQTYIEGVVARAVASAGGKRARKQTPVAKMTDDEFWAYLQSEPSLAGIDLGKEKGKCLFWCKNNGALFTRRRFINWLNKADRNLSLHGRDAGTRAADLADRANPPPHGWQEFMKGKQRDWTATNGTAYEPPGADALARDDFFGFPKSWRDECRRALGEGT